MQKLDFAWKLAWAREQKGLTQAAAAAKIGVTRLTITRWESGKVPLTERKLNAALIALEVDAKDIPSPPPAPLQYDEHGWPIGFKRLADTIPSGEEHDAAFDAAEEADDNALRSLEGPEYPARSRRRYELSLRHVSAERREAAMRRYDAEYPSEDLI